MRRLARRLFTLCSGITLRLTMLETAFLRVGRTRAATAIVALLASVSHAATAAGGEAVAGHWEGYIDGSCAVRLDLSRVGDKWGGRGIVFPLDQQVSLGEVEVTSLFLAPTEVAGLIHCDAWGKCKMRAFVEAGELTGTLAIGGKPYPVRMRRDHAAPAIEPWEPDRPVPYAAEPVAFPSGGIRIGGELTVPRVARPHPAVILLSGGGAHDRDGNAFAGQGSAFYRVIADHLTRRGFAVLRTDDRGIGTSTGDYESATLSDLADDTVAAVAYLRGRPGIRPGQIALLGFSEGAVVAPLAATRTEAVSLLVLLAPEAVLGAEGDIDRERRAAERPDQPEWVVSVKTLRVEFRRRLFPLLLRGADRDTIRRELFADGRFEASMIEAGVRDLASPRNAFAFRHDAGAVLEETRVPTLAIYGGRDDVVPPDLNVPALRAAAERGRNPDVTVKVFPEYDHLMTRPYVPEVKRGLSWKRRTVAPDVLSTVSDWLARQFAERNRPKAD